MLHFSPSDDLMKRVSQLTALALALGLASSAFSAETAKTLTFTHLLQQKGAAIRA